MPRVIEKVAVIVHYTDGKSDEGFIPLPLASGGQAKVEFFMLNRVDDTSVLVNLLHVIRVEQSIILKE
ncbi:hypothetical protein DXF85_02830 [Citrobacter pasteurii]|uniref:Uncharacterized protein n=1 Tax=Citrobacter pasteurii TaxID=1563222 RepID=A0A6N6KCE3_9ENTR|nr:hypothetical protein [Citrobacter pasteurii]KAA1280230.1 hypothetical protein DXF85_02830 [Citrobacter pasteurii]